MKYTDYTVEVLKIQAFLKILQIFTGNLLCWISFKQNRRPSGFIKKRLQHFPVKFVKFSSTL